MRIQVPVALQKQIHAYYDFAGGVSRQRKQLLPSLPKALSFELEIFLKRGIFLRLPFFQNCSVRIIMDLVPLVVSEHMMPGRIFVREGSLLDAMHMVARGQVLLMQGGDVQVGVRFAGGYLGEEALVHSNRIAQSTAMAGDWSQVLTLTGVNFRTLANSHPELLQRVTFHLRGKEATDVLKNEELALRMNQEGRRAATRGSILATAAPRGSTRGGSILATAAPRGSILQGGAPGATKPRGMSNLLGAAGLPKLQA